MDLCYNMKPTVSFFSSLSSILNYNFLLKNISNSLYKKKRMLLIARENIK